jgi:hypothetical protein
MLVKELKRRLRTLYKPNDHIAAHLWCSEDVFQVAGEIGETITKKAANEIIDDIDRHIDSELGITWVTIKCVLQNYLIEKRANGKRKNKV